MERSATRGLVWGILVSLGFTLLIYLLGHRLESIPHLPDQGASWYYWKLSEPTFWTRLSAWGLYGLHQVANWGLIYYAQKHNLRYSNRLHPVNYWALGINALFIVIHLVQTHVWYDGLAQDVSIWSSQASVAILLVLVLIMENQRRGLFFGRKVSLPQEAVRALRQYHGYLFSWAAIYTFWYHPAEGTYGHLIGFFYMFLIMLQGSLFFTRIHINRWWMLVQEFLVLIHAVLVAIMQGNGMWPMFGFGFGAIFIVTQMYGLPWSRKVRWGVTAAYIGYAIYVYSGRGWAKAYEILSIPLIDYLAVFLLAWLVAGLVRLWPLGQRQPQGGAD